MESPLPAPKAGLPVTRIRRPHTGRLAPSARLLAAELGAHHGGNPVDDATALSLRASWVALAGRTISLTAFRLHANLPKLVVNRGAAPAAVKQRPAHYGPDVKAYTFERFEPYAEAIRAVVRGTVLLRPPVVEKTVPPRPLPPFEWSQASSRDYVRIRVTELKAFYEAEQRELEFQRGA